MNRKKERRRIRRNPVIVLLMIMVLSGIFYSSAAFASDMSEEPQENSATLLATGDTHTYTAENYFDASGTSTNAHFNVKGIFVDDTNHAYLVLFLQKNTNVKDIMYITVNGTKIDTPNTDHWNSEITVNLPDGTSKVLQSQYGMLVIEAGMISNMQEQFVIDIKTTAGGWDVTGLPVTVDIDYSIRKKAEPDSAGIGDKITYTIEVINNSEIALQGVEITDVIPKGLTVLSVNGSENLSWKTEDQELYLDRDITLGVSETKTYTVTAEVNTDAAAGILSNTAVIGGSVIPKTDSAEVTVCINHTVTVKKIVTGNLGDMGKEFTFTAVVTDENGNVVKIPSKEDSPYTVNESGVISFQLKNEGFIQITGIPDGATFTVTETDGNANGYETAYDWSIDNTNWSAGSSGVIHQDTTFQITNEKNGIINTDIDLDHLPFVLILSAAALCFVIFVIYECRKTE